MKTANRIYQLAAARPAEAVEDIIGLAAICGLVFVGFAVTAIA